jgi:hypothetical protein
MFIGRNIFSMAPDMDKLLGTTTRKTNLLAWLRAVQQMDALDYLAAADVLRGLCKDFRGCIVNLPKWKKEAYMALEMRLVP